MKRFALIFFLLQLLVSPLYATLTINITTSPENCSGSNGTIQAFPSGGSQPYICQWSNGSTSFQLMGLPAGTYTITVTDGVGDTASAIAIVANLPTLIVPLLSFNNSFPCNSQCNGIAYLSESAIQGTPPYQMMFTYTSNPNLGMNIINGVNAVTNICVADTYEVTVMDATGCTASLFMTPIFNEKSFDHQAQVNGACTGQSNGSVTFNFSNLYQPALIVSYSGPVSGSLPLWNPALISNLPSGNYVFNVAYQNIFNCDTTILITVPDIGPTCGLISGKVYLDTIPNCIADVNEPSVPQQLIRFDPGSYFATSDVAGNYSAALPFATYTATLLSANPLFPVCAVSNLVLSAINDTLTNIDLADSVNITTDLTVGITTGAFRPGFPGYVYPSIQNLSLDLIPNPTLDIYYDSLLTYQFSPNHIPSINVPGHLQFMLNAINSFASASFYIQFLTPANVNLLGTTLNFTAVVHANIPEPDTLNNTDSTSVTITGGYDPNDKAVLPSRDPFNTFYTDLDDEFRYTIRFQNTGTDTTFNVVVIDTLDLNLDPSTLRIISFSHPMHWELNGQGVLKFYFDNILLPDSNINEPASHGVVSYTIQPNSQSIPNYNVYNRADIYFDFNPPVLTNTISSLVTISVGISSVSKQKQLMVIPNPASTKIEVQLLDDLHAQKVSVFNSLGQEVMKVKAEFINRKQQIDISQLPDGYYLLNIQAINGQMVSTGLLIQH